MFELCIIKVVLKEKDDYEVSYQLLLLPIFYFINKNPFILASMKCVSSLAVPSKIIYLKKFKYLTSKKNLYFQQRFYISYITICMYVLRSSNGLIS